MTSEQTNLHVLSRAQPGAPPAAIPPPRRRWLTRVLLPSGILLGVALLLGYAARDALRPATPVTVVPVVVRSGGDAGAAVTVQAPGWVEADPFAFSASALADGVVQDVLVLEGQRVEAGQVVAQLVDEDAKLALAQARAEVAERQAELAAAEAALHAAQREWDHPVERQRAVAVAQARRAEVGAELERLPAVIDAEQARFQELREEARLREQALAGRAATQIEALQARLRAQAQEANLAAVTARRPILQARQRELEAELAAAQEHLRLRIVEARALDEAKAALNRTRAAVQRATVLQQQAELRLARVQVRAPRAGVVMRRLAEPGDKVMVFGDQPDSARIVRLYDPARLQVRVDVPLANAAAVGVGHEAQIVVEILPERIFRGRITRVVPEADIQKNTLQVKVAIDDPHEHLKPEMLARVRFLAPPEQAITTSQRVFAPEELLQRNDSDQAQTWVVEPGRSIASLRPVTLGAARHQGWIEVAQGLQPGDRLIAGDTRSLRPGVTVRVVREAPTGEESAARMTRSQGGTRHGAD